MAAGAARRPGTVGCVARSAVSRASGWALSRASGWALSRASGCTADATSAGLSLRSALDTAGSVTKSRLRLVTKAPGAVLSNSRILPVRCRNTSPVSASSTSSSRILPRIACTRNWVRPCLISTLVKPLPDKSLISASLLTVAVAAVPKRARAAVSAITRLIPVLLANGRVRSRALRHGCGPDCCESIPCKFNCRFLTPGAARINQSLCTAPVTKAITSRVYARVVSDFDVEVQCLGNGKDILVAATAHVHDDQMLFWQGWRDFHHMRQGVAGLQRRNDPFHRAA